MVAVTDELPVPEQRSTHPDHLIDQSQHTALKMRLARLELLVGLGHSGAGSLEHHLPAWLRPTKGEHRLPVTLAVIAAIALQVFTPEELVFRPRYLLPGLEVLLFIVLIVGNPSRINRETKLLRF